MMTIPAAIQTSTNEVINDASAKGRGVAKGNGTSFQQLFGEMSNRASEKDTHSAHAKDKMQSTSANEKKSALPGEAAKTDGNEKAPPKNQLDSESDTDTLKNAAEIAGNAAAGQLLAMTTEYRADVPSEADNALIGDMDRIHAENTGKKIHAGDLGKIHADDAGRMIHADDVIRDDRGNKVRLADAKVAEAFYAMKEEPLDKDMTSKIKAAADAIGASDISGTRGKNKNLLSLNDTRMTKKSDTAEAGNKVADNRFAPKEPVLKDKPAFGENLQKEAGTSEQKNTISEAQTTSVIQAQNTSVTQSQIATHQTIKEQFDPASNRIMQYVGGTGWDQAISQKVIWMAGNELQRASLILNPPELGPLQVVLKISNNEATATFVSAYPEVRHALEMSIPRLKEMFDQAGIQLGQTHVGADTPNNQSSSSSDNEVAVLDDVHETEGLSDTATHKSVPLAKRGLVDTFA